MWPMGVLLWPEGFLYDRKPRPLCSYGGTCGRRLPFSPICPAALASFPFCCLSLLSVNCSKVNLKNKHRM